MKIYVFDVTGNRHWSKNVGDITTLEAQGLAIPSKDDLLIIHFTDYRNYRQDYTYREGEDQPYILWVSGGSPETINTRKQHWYQERLEHNIDKNHQFFVKLKSFIDRLKTGIYDWTLLYSKGEEAAVQRLRSEILTPFVLLHLGLQMKDSFFNNDFTQEEKECCSKGVELLGEKSGEVQLLSRFMELLKLPSSMGERKPLEEECANKFKQKVNTFIEGHSERIKSILGCLANGDVTRAKNSANGYESDLCTAIEGLAQTLEEIVAYVEFGEQPSIQ